MSKIIIFHQRLKWIGLTFLLILISLQSYSQSADSLKVLFVGNSYTYFWNLPQTVSSIAESQDRYILTRQSTAGGASLKDHWDGEKNLKSRMLIESGNWDIVVIQNHSLSSINDEESFFDYGNKFIDLVKKNGAEPILYSTWARELNPTLLDAISKAYNKLGADNGVRVVQAGTLWNEIRKLRPELKLYDPDGSHPSTIGTYATACLFYSFLTGDNTQKIPNRLTTIDKDGEKLYLSIMAVDNSDFLHDVIDRLQKK